MAKTYSDLLKDPRWQRKRLEIFERDNWTCLKCNDSSNTLHVHHTSYIKGRAPWEYEGEYFETLCVSCHDKEHNKVIEPEERVWRWEIKQHQDSHITAIQTHIDILMQRLSKGVPKDLETEIMKNILYLQQKRKEYLDGK
jgi:hypothetical protein